jgi:hypothetical protein
MNLWLSLLLLLLPAPVKTEHGRFNIVKEGRKIGTDDFTISRHNSNYVLESKSTIADQAISSRMELTDKLIPVSYEVSSSDGTIKVNVGNPLSELQTVVKGGETSSADFRFPEAGIILDNNIFDHYLMLMYRVQTGQTNFSVFVPQDKSLGMATVRSTGPRSYTLEIGDVRMEATVDSDGSLLRLVVPAAKVIVER